MASKNRSVIDKNSNLIIPDGFNPPPDWDTRRISMKIAYLKGVHAARDGNRKSDCPYRACGAAGISLLVDAWKEGHHDYFHRTPDGLLPEVATP